jgi:hypothetical protein
MGTPRRGLSALALFATATVALTTLASGCLNGDVGEPGTSCQSTRTYFLNEVWGPVMGRTCVNCHSPGGTARLQGARFELLPASYPDFVETNLRNIQEMAGYSYNGTSLILAKPMGLTTHGGGTIFTPGSNEYNAINGLLSRLNAGANNDSCPDYGSVATPSGVQTLDWPQTLRRVSLDLLGRLPTDAETAAAHDEAGFTTVLESGLGASATAGSTQTGYLNEEAFYERMQTAWNDVLLTDRYISGDGCDQRALNMISNRDFPNRGTYGGGATAGLDCCGMDRDNPMCGTVRDFFLQANNAVAREPINLIDHVIRTNRPFTEILTANYVMVNPQSAHIYGIDDQVPGGNIYGDANALYEGRVHYNRYISDTETEPVDFPHAGVLTTAAFLNRYPTTVTNRNRHRARTVQAFFLATDILKVGERPIDATASEALVMTPTMNYGPCVTCHRLNDPIAGSFRGFYDRNTGAQWRYDPHDAWYTDMFPPGYAGENMPGAEYPRALQWLAPRVAQDQRFASSVVRFVYTALTGRQPLTYPTDTTNADAYAQQSAAWIEQDRVFRAVAQRFIASNLNFKTVVLELVKSPLYRAVAIPLPADATPDQIATQMARHAGIGSSAMLTPEVLDRRITAIAGFPWARDRSNPTDGGTWLEHDFYFPYGGINSDTIIRRPTDPSGVIVNIAQRMATEVACRGTAWDFTRPQAERRFFRSVELNTVPESAGNTVPASVSAIRANIVQLHQLILGETLSPNDPEVDRTYNLFLDTWHEVMTPPMGMTMPDTNIPGECQARVDLTTGDTLPDMQQINDDPNGSIRAWQAVLTYLFSDYRFIYQ